MVTGGERGITLGRRGRDSLKNMYKCPMGMDNSVGIDCGSGGWDEGKGGKIGTTIIE